MSMSARYFSLSILLTLTLAPACNNGDDDDSAGSADSTSGSATVSTAASSTSSTNTSTSTSTSSMDTAEGSTTDDPTPEQALCARSDECNVLMPGVSVQDCTDLVLMCTDDLITSAYQDWS